MGAKCHYPFGSLASFVSEMGVISYTTSYHLASS